MQDVLHKLKAISKSVSFVTINGFCDICIHTSLWRGNCHNLHFKAPIFCVQSPSVDNGLDTLDRS